MENQIPPTPPQNIPAEQPIVENSNKSFWKTIAIGMSIVSFCIALAIGGYLLGANRNKTAEAPTSQITATPTPTLISDPTANWKTYTSAKYGFSFKYPPEFTFKETSTQIGFLIKNTEEILLRNSTDETQLTDPNATRVWVSPLITDGKVTDAQKWLEDNKIGYSTITGEPKTTIENLTKTRIANLDAVVYEAGAESSGKNVLFYKDEKLVLFTLAPTGETGSTYKDVKQASINFDKILSTFKFTE